MKAITWLRNPWVSFVVVALNGAHWYAYMIDYHVNLLWPIVSTVATLPFFLGVWRLSK